MNNQLNTQKPTTNIMLSLNERKIEFADAVKRAAKSTFDIKTVGENTFEIISLVTKKTYLVRLDSEGKNLLASCNCPDHTHRKRICKHISEVLTDVLFTAFAK